MWHKITFVAESRRIAPEALQRFATDRREQYGLVNDGTGLEVSTWHVDKLVADFNASVAPAAGQYDATHGMDH
ncbi:hypothetical protein [Ralstonia pseudosolanacearum]|uniref:hypothetical protein n=1 Tax=Ralstonia pseudosolanacearum TaxID=1310165 RepID=UPI003CEA7295